MKRLGIHLVSQGKVCNIHALEAGDPEDAGGGDEKTRRIDESVEKQGVRLGISIRMQLFLSLALLLFVGCGLEENFHPRTRNVVVVGFVVVQAVWLGFNAVLNSRFHRGQEKDMPGKARPALMIGAAAALGLALLIFFPAFQNHSLAKDIGLPLEDKRSEVSLHTTQVALVYSKKGLDFDLYDSIRKKATSRYGKEKFQEGTELALNKAPDPAAIEDRYKNGMKRAFWIESLDQYASIWIFDYDDHVGVVLVDRR